MLETTLGPQAEFSLSLSLSYKARNGPKTVSDHQSVKNLPLPYAVGHDCKVLLPYSNVTSRAMAG